MREQIETFILSGGHEGSFDDLALALFAYQYEHVPMYRRLCEGRAIRPGDVSAWERIPAIPVEAFRYGLDDGDRPYVFMSSGTTGGAEGRSRHALTTLRTYELSALCHFESMVLADAPGELPTLILGPTARTHPHSSLGQMFSWIAETYSGGNLLVAFDEDGTVALDDALRWLAAASLASAPVLILCITSAITAVLDAIRRGGKALRLPADSRIVDTGGTKTYAGPSNSAARSQAARTYSPRALLKAAWNWLHVPGYMCVNEYGMTEMLSQFYDDALRTRVRGELGPRAKVGPPWTRTVVVDPATLEPVPPGTKGLLRHFDLANVDSVMALQTLDVGHTAGNGFAVLGRARDADQRGCSALLRAVIGSAAER